MKKTKELMKKIDELILSSKDEDLIKVLGGFKSDVNAIDEEYHVLEDKHTKAVELYADAIAKSGTAEEPQDATKEEAPLTLEDIFNAK